MKETELNEEQTFEFAKQLLETRVAGSRNTFTNKSIEDVLKYQREEDRGNGLWEVFNRVQENIVEGNFQYLTPSGKLRQARPIKNFRQDMNINARMYEQALTFAA
jgi:PAS domain-containing protein